MKETFRTAFVFDNQDGFQKLKVIKPVLIKNPEGKPSEVTSESIDEIKKTLAKSDRFFFPDSLGGLTRASTDTQIIIYTEYTPS